MFNTIPTWLRLRFFLFRRIPAFGLVFSLICLGGLLANHTFARAGQAKQIERIDPKSEHKSLAPKTDLVKEKDRGKGQEGSLAGRTANQVKALTKAPEDWRAKFGARITQINIPPALQSRDLGPVHEIYDRLLLDVPGLDSQRLLLQKRLIEDFNKQTSELFKDEINKLTSKIVESENTRGQIVEPGPKIPFANTSVAAAAKLDDLIEVPKNPSASTSVAAAAKPGDRTEKPKNPFANTSVVTAAKLEDGTEVLTVIDMPGSIDAGELRGRMEPLSKDTDNTARVRKIIGELGPGTRVFYYGNELRNIDLTTIANNAGVELVRRANTKRDLLSVQQRLDTIANRDFDPERTVIVNGLPASEEAVASMGPFAGRAETWLKFRESIDTNTRPDVKTSSEKGVLFRELQKEDSDLVVLVAHSDGLYVYLDGSRVSLDEISGLPNRENRSERPRQAIIISCNAGKVNSPSGWRRIFRRQYTPLGRSLVEKGFVDQVIAPDHQIDAAETLETFKKVLSGATHLNFEHWNRIALWFHPHYGVVS